MDLFNIALFALLAVLVFFMFRNNKKRKQQVEEQKSQFVPGAEIMTNFGLFGTIMSIDELSNIAEIEISPGNVVRVHRQAIAKVITETEQGDSDAPRSVEEAIARANREEAERAAATGTTTPDATTDTTPEFGERIEPTQPGTSKKVDE
jgi:preprotein translocase subunit YajC